MHVAYHTAKRITRQIKRQLPRRQRRAFNREVGRPLRRAVKQLAQPVSAQDVTDLARLTERHHRLDELVEQARDYTAAEQFEQTRLAESVDSLRSHTVESCLAANPQMDGRQLLAWVRLAALLMRGGHEWSAPTQFLLRCGALRDLTVAQPTHLLYLLAPLCPEPDQLIVATQRICRMDAAQRRTAGALAADWDGTAHDLLDAAATLSSDA